MPMRVRLRVSLILAILSLGGTRPLCADLKQAQAEPNLEKRSKLALDNAITVLQAARHAYRDGDNEKAAALTAEVQESVELAFASLQQTNKDPRRSPRCFKSAEMATRDLLRKIESPAGHKLATHPMLDKVKEETKQVHDDLLLGLMEGKKK